jgi:hypothetical protein
MIHELEAMNFKVHNINIETPLFPQDHVMMARVSVLEISIISSDDDNLIAMTIPQIAHCFKGTTLTINCSHHMFHNDPDVYLNLDLDSLHTVRHLTINPTIFAPMENAKYVVRSLPVNLESLDISRSLLCIHLNDNAPELTKLQTASLFITEISPSSFKKLLANPFVNVQCWPTDHTNNIIPHFAHVKGSVDANLQHCNGDFDYVFRHFLCSEIKLHNNSYQDWQKSFMYQDCQMEKHINPHIKYLEFSTDSWPYDDIAPCSLSKYVDNLLLRLPELKSLKYSSCVMSDQTLIFCDHQNLETISLYYTMLTDIHQQPVVVFRNMPKLANVELVIFGYCNHVYNVPIFENVLSLNTLSLHTRETNGQILSIRPKKMLPNATPRKLCVAVGHNKIPSWVYDIKCEQLDIKSTWIHKQNVQHPKANELILECGTDMPVFDLCRVKILTLRGYLSNSDKTYFADVSNVHTLHLQFLDVVSIYLLNLQYGLWTSLRVIHVHHKYWKNLVTVINNLHAHVVVYFYFDE